MTSEIKKCGNCEYLGDCAFPVVRYYVGGELKSKFVGYSDRPNGGVVEQPSRHCNHVNMKKTLVYEKSEACRDFKPKEWVRPNYCGQCDRRINRQIGEFHCDGYPFYAIRSNNDVACINGKTYNNKITQLTIFDI